MQPKFRNKYRIESTRLQHWDYGWDAAYFITICTKGRVYYFGDVTQGIMELNEIGKIAETEWLKTFEMRPDMNLLMGEYVIMPNHFHAILIIGQNQYNSIGSTDAMHCDPNSTDAMHCVSTSIPGDIPMDIPKNQFGPQSKNLASIIRGFKIGVTTRARTINNNFSWQPRFHDHVIRDGKSFERISAYIQNNPAKWKGDKFFKKDF